MLIYRDIIDPDTVGALVVIDDPFPRLATHHAMNPGGHLVIDTDITLLIPPDREGAGFG